MLRQSTRPVAASGSFSVVVFSIRNAVFRAAVFPWTLLSRVGAAIRALRRLPHFWACFFVPGFPSIFGYANRDSGREFDRSSPSGTMVVSFSVFRFWAPLPCVGRQLLMSPQFAASVVV